MDEAECRRCQGQTVGEGEGRDRGQQTLERSNQQEQSRNKGQMVETCENMRDAQSAVGAENVKTARRLRHGEAGVLGRQSQGRHFAGWLDDTNQCVGERVLQTLELRHPAIRRCGADDTSDNHSSAWRILRAGLLELATVRHHKAHLQGPAAQSRQLQHHVKGRVGSGAKFEICRAHFVGDRRAGQGEEDQRQPPHDLHGFEPTTMRTALASSETWYRRSRSAPALTLASCDASASQSASTWPRTSPNFGGAKAFLAVTFTR